MRINNANPSTVNPPAVNTGQRSARAQQQRDAAAGAGAQSQAALGASVVNLTSLALGTSDVRTAKVEALRQQVAAGKYQPQLQSTADKMAGDPINDLDGDGRG